jgi:hypothetical protein
VQDTAADVAVGEPGGPDFSWIRLFFRVDHLVYRGDLSAGLFEEPVPFRGPSDVDEQAAVCGFDQIAGQERLAMLYYSQIP